jgi:TonB family protein
VERLDQRQGFLISALAHLVIIMALASRTNPGSTRAEAPPSTIPEVSRRVVFLPPPAQLRQILPPQARPRQPAPPAPTPPPAGKDRISIGPPVAARDKGPLILRREDDLTKVAKGRPDAVPSPAPPQEPAPPQTQAAQARPPAVPEVRGAPGLRLPPGLGNMTVPQGTDGSRGRTGDPTPSITNSLRNLDRKLQDAGPIGLPSGTVQEMSGLRFDPEGADFTVWINEFKNEVYRNWIMPQPALMGFRGHVDLEFTVERDGTLTNLKLLKSSGTPALDRAAQNALLGSRLLALPSDYAPPRVTMQVSFYEAPAGS